MLTQLTQPDQLPVSLQQIKAQLRLDHGDDDEHLIHLITSGTAWIENHIGKSLLAQTWCQTWESHGKKQDGLQGHRERTTHFFLGKLPLLSIKSVILIAPNNHRQSILTHRVGDAAGRVYLQLKYPLPEAHCLEVIYTSGFGERPDDVPADIRQALLLYVSCLYEHRTGIDRGNLLALYGLLSPYRVMRMP